MEGMYSGILCMFGLALQMQILENNSMIQEQKDTLSTIHAINVDSEHVQKLYAMAEPIQCKQSHLIDFIEKEVD